MKVLNFGSLNLDQVFQVQHISLPGETISANSQQIHCGGKGLNQSIALKRAGAEVFHAGCVGKGGEDLLKMLSSFGVDIRFIQTRDELQGTAFIQVDQNGQNSIVLFGGSNQCITKRQISETLSHFNEGDYLLLQNEVNELPEIVDQAFARGIKVVLNPSPFNEKLDEVDFSKLSWLNLNETEASELLRKRKEAEGEKFFNTLSETEVSDFCSFFAFLHQRYPELSIVLTLGEKGSICFSGEQKIFQPAIPVTVVDTTAAGDTFTGFFFAGVTQGLPLSECMKHAATAAALSVTKRGAAQSIPSKDEVIEKERKNI